jgi:phage gp29-like protein
MKPPTSIKDSIAQFFRDLIPTRVVTRHDPRSISAALAHTVTVDRVAEIFRSAENGHTELLFALYRDIIIAHSHLQGRFADRKRAVLGDTLHVQPFAKKVAVDVAAAEAVWPITQHPDFSGACNHLLDAALWPVAVVEKVYRPSTKPGLKYELARLVPVPHDLLDFTTGKLRIKDTDEAGRPLGTSHDATPHRYIVHRGHLLTTPDHWGGPMRSLVFWWLLSTMGREWWGRFLDRYGGAFMVGKYDQGDDESRSVLERAFQFSTKVGGLVVTKETEVEIKQAAAGDSGQAFASFYTLCNEEISKLILGQTLSSDAKATGMGSGVANTQDAVRQDIRQFDARQLGVTFTTQLAAQFLFINGLKGQAPLFMWGAISSAEMKALADVLTALSTSGLQVTDEGIETLSDRFGMPLQRTPAVAAPNPFSSFSVHAAKGITDAEDGVARAAAASLAQTLGTHHARIAQIVRESRSPSDALAKVEAYTTNFDRREAARIVEEVMIAYLANGSASAAR